MKGLLIGLGIVGVIVILAVSSYISAHNSGVNFETQITASYENLQNILGQYSTKVAEAAQVPAAMRDDLKEVMQSSLSARYGADGSKATVQWIKENYPGKVDPQLYRQIEQIIEAGRDKFQNEQTVFIDLKRGYNAQLGYFWSGLWLKIAGYPKIDLDKFKTVTSAHAQEAFKTGVEQPITLRK